MMVEGAGPSGRDCHHFECLYDRFRNAAVRWPFFISQPIAFSRGYPRTRAGSASERTAKSWLFRRCFSLIFFPNN
jgi:hypothetical protein